MGEPARLVKGLMVHERNAGAVEVSFLTDPVAALPLCIGVMVANHGTESIRIAPESFFVQDIKASETKYKAAVDQWKRDLEVYENVRLSRPPRPVFTAARVLDPEEVLARAEIHAAKARTRAEHNRAGSTAAFLLSDTDLQLAFSERVTDAERDFDRFKDTAERVRTAWFRTTDLAHGEKVQGLVCMELDADFALGVILNVPVGQDTARMTYRIEQHALAR